MAGDFKRKEATCILRMVKSGGADYPNVNLHVVKSA
jgi:hypothetical protein